MQEAIQNNIPVCSIPGPCALVSALISSGIPAKEFSFIGFLPVPKKKKEEKLNSIKDYETTLIFYEAPHKLVSTLETMLACLGNRNIVLCRELTKIHEEFIRGKLSEIIESINEPKGEFVIVVEGNISKTDTEIEFLNSLSLEEHFAYYQKLGYSKKDTIKQIAKDRDVNKNEIYQQFLDK